MERPPSLTRLAQVVFSQPPLYGRPSQGVVGANVINPQAGNGVTRVDAQNGFIMDYTPRYADPAGTRAMLLDEWIFDPAVHLPRLCLKVCQP